MKNILLILFMTLIFIDISKAQIRDSSLLILKRYIIGSAYDLGSENFDYYGNGSLMRIRGTGGAFDHIFCTERGMDVFYRIIHNDSLVYDSRGRLYEKFENFIDYSHGSPRYYSRYDKYLYDSLSRIKEHFSHNRNDDNSGMFDTNRVYKYENDKIKEISINVSDSAHKDSILYRYNYKYLNKNRLEILTQGFWEGKWHGETLIKIIIFDDFNRIVTDTLINIKDNNYNQYSKYQYDINGEILKEYHYLYKEKNITSFTNHRIDSVNFSSEDYYEIEDDVWFYCFRYWKDEYFYNEKGNIIKQLISFNGKDNYGDYSGSETIDYIYVNIEVPVQETNIQTNKMMVIYPNPTSERISIYFSKGINQSIEICNSLGMKIYQSIENELFDKNTINLSVQRFPSGIYYCTLSSGMDKITRSFVVIR